MPHDIALYSQNGQETSSSFRAHPSLLLIDDDLIFVKIMARSARTEGLLLTYLSRLEEISSLCFREIDLMLIDFELEKISGMQFISLLERWSDVPPCILISSHSYIDKKKWPPSVLKFIPKSLGPTDILRAAVATYYEFKKNEG